MAIPSSSPPPPPPEEDQNIHHQNENQEQPQSPPPLSPPRTIPNSPKPTTPTKKTQPLPWTHQETINLIQAYQEKWYSLKKGQLKASQWEEVAITVAARCAYDEPSKSAIQCRHKIEKLRKRYRAERVKPRPNSWQYFDLMDQMERGPLPISARPMAIVHYNQNNQPNSSDSDLEFNPTSNLDSKKNKSKSINHIVRGGNSINNVERSARVLRVSRNPIFRKRKDFFESDNDNDDDDDEEQQDEEEQQDDEEEEGGGGSEMVAELAAEIRAFAERFVKMESKKIEMMRDTQKYRLEMENKRMEMIVESQQKLVDTIHKAFSSSHKKMKMAQ